MIKLCCITLIQLHSVIKIKCINRIDNRGNQKIIFLIIYIYIYIHSGFWWLRGGKCLDEFVKNENLWQIFFFPIFHIFLQKMLNEVLKSCKNEICSYKHWLKKQEIKELVASCILHVSGMYIFHLILLGFSSSLFLPSIKEGVGWGIFI